MPRRSYNLVGGGLVQTPSGYLLSKSASNQVAAYDHTFRLQWKKTYALGDLTFPEDDLSSHLMAPEAAGERMLQSMQHSFISQLSMVNRDRYLIMASKPKLGHHELLLIGASGEVVAMGRTTAFISAVAGGYIFIHPNLNSDEANVFHVYKLKR